MHTADVYSIWSATTVVQLLSVHTRDAEAYAKYLNIGQKARYIHGKRPKNDEEETYRDADLGILNELHKQFTAMHRWKHRDTPEGGMQLLQHIDHMDYMIEEIKRLTQILPHQLPRADLLQQQEGHAC